MRVRILVCCSETPRPPLNGSRLVAWQLCTRLARTHDVTVVALRHPDQDGAPPDGVRLREVPFAPRSRVGAWAARGAALVRREPVGTRRSVSALAPAVRAMAGRVDVAHVMLGDIAGLAPALDVPAVIAPLDVWHRNIEAQAAGSGGPERMWRRAQTGAVRRFESLAYRPFARTVLVTDEDARQLRTLDPSLRTVVIPNGVDAQSFTADGRARSGVLFTGALNSPANEQAAVRLAERIMPVVRQSVPDARLHLVGRAPGPRIRALDATVVADVPDLRPHLWGAAVYACPMDSGTGIKNKLLEAMAAGVPAVATSLACQGLTVRDGVQLRIAEDDEAFARAVVDCLRAPGGLAAAAREYVLAHHSWDAVTDAYVTLYREISVGP